MTDAEKIMAAKDGDVMIVDDPRNVLVFPNGLVVIIRNIQDRVPSERDKELDDGFLNYVIHEDLIDFWRVQ